MAEDKTVLSIADLHVNFTVERGMVHAVRGVAFNLEKGTRTAVLGETGCGKSVMAMAVFKLLPKNAWIRGKIRLFGYLDISALASKQIRSLRGDAMVLLPQNPLGQLNPVYTVGFHLRESIRRLGKKNRRLTKMTSLSLLAKTGLSDPERIYESHPTQLSGGMAQQVVLALGLAAGPSLVVADEPTKGLDNTARDLYLRLTKDLFGAAAFLMITHDLDAACTFERCMVMYAGKIVEDGPAKSVLTSPLHPYTFGLVSSHPSKGLISIPGDSPAMGENHKGCVFHPRCSRKSERCIIESPDGREKNGIKVWCHHA